MIARFLDCSNHFATSRLLYSQNHPALGAHPPKEAKHKAAINFVTLPLCNFATSQMRKIKLIWDFRGPAAAKTAEHHEIHLKEYIEMEKIPLNLTGFEISNEMHAIAFMVVTDEYMIPVRDALKPHRGEIYQE